MCLNGITWSMLLSDLWNHVLEHVEINFRLKKAEPYYKTQEILFPKCR